MAWHGTASWYKNTHAILRWQHTLFPRARDPSLPVEAALLAKEHLAQGRTYRPLLAPQLLLDLHATMREATPTETPVALRSEIQHASTYNSAVLPHRVPAHKSDHHQQHSSSPSVQSTQTVYFYYYCCAMDKFFVRCPHIQLSRNR